VKAGLEKTAWACRCLRSGLDILNICLAADNLERDACLPTPCAAHPKRLSRLHGLSKAGWGDSAGVTQNSIVCDISTVRFCTAPHDGNTEHCNGEQQVQVQVCAVSVQKLLAVRNAQSLHNSHCVPGWSGTRVSDKLIGRMRRKIYHQFC
jgi:hypothetical protein